MLRLFSLGALIGLAAMADGAFAHENEVDVRLEGAQLCVTSNSSPNHDIGQFPNRGNPNSFRQQATRVCVDADPEVTRRITQHSQSSGVSVTGILFRPGTADFYDANSPRGFSRDPSSGWRLEGMGAAELLGMDAQNAHVDHWGLYHYHGVSEALVGSQLDQAAMDAAVAAARAAATPISDKRGTAEYRTHVVGILVSRAIANARARIEEARS